ncbi:MAG: hypothetical protein AB8F34_07935 [Akkermansiaceae bacterium]
MVSLSVLLLVGFRTQINKLRSQVEAFGLDNLLIVETITPTDINQGVPVDRFRSISKHGNLFTARKMLASARSSSGRSAAVVAYTDEDIAGLLPYLKYGHEVFVLTLQDPEGLVVDYQIQDLEVRGVALRPEEKIIQLIQGDTLFVPHSMVKHLDERGFTMVYYLQKDKDAPDVSKLSKAVYSVIRSDGDGKVDVKSAVMLRDKLRKLEGQQETMRVSLAAILGGALALVYGVLSILEFRQSMYVSALLRSFGVSNIMLGIRTVFENLLIVNVVSVAVIYILSLYHNKIFVHFKVKALDNVTDLYWGDETFFIMLAANIGVLISSLPVFWALRKPVGQVLE